MKKGKKSLLYYWVIALLSLVMAIEIAFATEPRITPGILSPDRLELFTYESPPLASMDIPGGGLYPEIIQAALDKVNVKATITILPVKSLVKYNLLQDSALGIIGGEWNFSEEERSQLIAIPFYILKGGYYYYRADGGKELSVDVGLSNLRGLTYGAQKGEDVSGFIEEGIPVKYGNILSLYKKLKSGEIDFMSAPDLSKEWIVETDDSVKNGEYTRISHSSWETFSPIIFNKENIEAETFSAKFAEGLKKIILDGTYVDILEKYHGKGNISKDYILRLDHRLRRTDSLNKQ